MNKELIKKYKAEFDHWLNGGEVLGCKVLYKLQEYAVDWQPLGKDYKWDTDINIVINDEYVEFRKALAEGKTVQYYRCVYAHEMCCNLDKYEWTDLQTNIFDLPIETYRIKPEEPKFKVSDWIRTFEGIKQIEDEYQLKRLTENYIGPAFSLWKPKPGEYIWDKDHGLCKVTTNCVTNEIGTAFNCIDIFKIGSPEFTTMLEYCQPFIGQLPTHLKD